MMNVTKQGDEVTIKLTVDEEYTLQAILILYTR